jgi:hypothetical protein
MKSYRFFGDEMEVLGNRLDQARKRVAESKTEWARNYWSQNVDRLMFQWRQLPILHDGDARMTLMPRWTIDYNFCEHSGYTGYNDLADRAYNKIFRNSANLDASWEAHRAQRLARAQ